MKQPCVPSSDFQKTKDVCGIMDYLHKNDILYEVDKDMSIVLVDDNKL